MPFVAVFSAVSESQDALTHTEQLEMLRRIGGCPMNGESNTHAEIVIGRVGFEQAPANPKYEFD